jgi:catechol 2,3-dioxygenase-like lactoylglutathione lyase family enzyme
MNMFFITIGDGGLSAKELSAKLREQDILCGAAKDGSPVMRLVTHYGIEQADIDRTIDFYSRVLGMEPVTFAGGRRALAFGQQKLNLHQAGREYEPKALRPAPGAIDLCFIAATPLDAVIESLKAQQVAIIQGPVPKTGALGPMQSVYFRDPDGNLVEVSHYDA